MGYDINICYHSKAYKYLKKLNQNERNKIMSLIDDRIKGFIENKDRRYIFKDVHFPKLGNFDSTVYYLKIKLKDRVILSIDEDPIFEQVIVNIFTICNHDQFNTEMRGIMESLYQKMINEESYDEEEEE
jgi:hypothetical protein